MTQYAAFRRVPVPPQAAQHYQTTILPAPTRGLIDSENLTYMQPGGAIVMDNWLPTMQGARIRGGCVLWADLYPGTTGDPYFSSVKLLLGFEGADAATGAPGMTDESSAAHGNATAVGNSQIDTAQFKFGTSSLLVDGTGDDITFPDSDDWTFPGQFTLEGWARFATAGAGQGTLLAHYAGIGARGWAIDWITTTGNWRFRFSTDGSSNAYIVTGGPGAPTANTWYHWAVDRDATNKTRLYLNGVMIGSQVSGGGTSFNGTQLLSLGMTADAGLPFNGWIDEVRITKGVARYASDAGFTVPTAAFLRNATVLPPPLTDPSRLPVISAFEYASGNIRKMFAANATKLYDVSSSGVSTLIVSGRLSGNYAASQLATAGGDFLIAVNDAGDFPLRFDGTTWTTLSTTTPPDWAISTAYAVNARARDTTDNSRWKCLVAHTSPGTGTFAAARAAAPTQWTIDVAAGGSPWIIGPSGTAVENGHNLVHVCKYRNRWFFIEQDSMNAWYLPLNAIGGSLALIPLSGAATQGGKLLFCATWSVDAGDGLDDKLVFMTTEGEALIFSGSNPADAANWRQEGRYQIPKPMGMNAHVSLGGDLLIATVEGIVPISAAITKDAEQLELAMITKNIRRTWRNEAITKNNFPWTMARWDEFGGMFVTWPGGAPGARYCAVVNTGTGAWARLPGYDATCFIKQGPNLFFGTQTGTIMQADRSGYDDGVPYVCTIVGGWEIFQTPPATVVWHQARAAFTARSGETFQPQLSATTDYIVTIPQPPPAGPDPGVLDLWDQGKWDVAKWDAPPSPTPTVRNTGWVSIGFTGFSHAPILQVTMAQQAKPQVELVSIGITYERAGVNV